MPVQLDQISAQSLNALIVDMVKKRVDLGTAKSIYSLSQDIEKAGLFGMTGRTIMRKIEAIFAVPVKDVGKIYTLIGGEGKVTRVVKCTENKVKES